MNNNNLTIISLTSNKTTKLSEHYPDPHLGEWYWVKDTVSYDHEGKKKGDEYTWLGCVMKIGTNFVELQSPHNGYERVHFDNFFERLELANNPQEVIQEHITFHQTEIRQSMDEIKRVCLSLGLDPKHFLSAPPQDNPEATDSQALMVISEKVDVKKYKNDLVIAQEKTLPDLFSKIKKSTENLNKWLLATTMETEALMGPMNATIGQIKGKIFNISLYAGLTEEVTQILDGPPAELLEKLHVMQRRLYMDEECLLNYSAGGMIFNGIPEFDRWLAIPENLSRILPFPRILVAFRVRRTEAEREFDGSLRDFIRITCEKEADKKTFFYIRNGEQLYRMDCDLEFPSMIFPDQSLYAPGEEMMMKTFCSRVDKMMPKREWEDLRDWEIEQKKKYDAWAKSNPGDNNWIRNPYHNSIGFRFSYKEWVPFDQSSVYFDDALAGIAEKIKKYNRIAIIIQGLYDRSLVLHPHLPVKTWTAEGFKKAIELIYDGKTTLYQSANAPDFEIFRAKCNRSLNSESVVTGQELYWEEQEAIKYNRVETNNWRNRNYRDVRRYRPYQNPGPGTVSKVLQFNKKKQVATFIWERPTIGWNTRKESIGCHLSVPANRLLNISAYHPGEYKQFFNDPRTREQYLKWAPFLLAAEDYYAIKKGD